MSERPGKAALAAIVARTACLGKERAYVVNIRDLRDVAAYVAELEEVVADLKMDVIAFCGPWSVEYAENSGLPKGHLHPVHYDILAKAGARMDDFVRHDLAAEPLKTKKPPA